MAFEMKCFQGVGAFEADLLGVSALKLSHPSACPVFKDFSLFSQLRHSLSGGRVTHQRMDTSFIFAIIG
jgi:hypothetical protein